MTPEEYRVSDEELAQLQSTIMDKAKKRLEMETCVRIYKRFDQLESGHFVACRAPGKPSHSFPPRFTCSK